MSFSVTNETVALSQGTSGDFLAQFSDGAGIDFTKFDFVNFVRCFDRKAAFFYTALQAFVSNNVDPRTATDTQLQSLLQAQTYVIVGGN